MKYIVYHGTGNSFRKFNLKKTTQGLFWFTDDKEAILSKEVGAQGHGYIYKCEIEINNPCGWKEYERLVQGQIEGMGYDGIILPDGGSNTYVVWKPEQVKILEKQKLQEALRESKTTKTITLTASDIDDTLEELLNAIKEIGNSGHGFSIEVDREYDAEYEDGAPKFYWDGDGGDKIKDIKVETLKESFDKRKYLAWKRKNVTIRGMKDRYAENGGMAKYGQGLYTAFLSNKEMARQYGTVYFVLGAIPKHPKVVNNVNDAEIFLYKVKIDWLKKHNAEFDAYDTRDFDAKTNVRDEMIALGFDGLVIKGREMVNYTPSEDEIKYFQNENQLIMHYEDFVEDSLNEKIDLTKADYHGLNGSVYKLSEDKALKITLDDREAATAYFFMNNPSPYYSKIYSVNKKENSRFTEFYIEREFLKKLSPLEEKIIKIAEFYYVGKSHLNLLPNAYKALEKEDFKTVDKVIKEFVSLYNSIKKINQEIYDINFSNIGRNKTGNLAGFDFQLNQVDSINKIPLLKEDITLDIDKGDTKFVNKVLKESLILLKAI